MKYQVCWDIELDADDPLSAAIQALEIHRDPDSTATVFLVIGEDGVGEQVEADQLRRMWPED